MIELKQSTIAVVIFGPLLDKTDGVTPLTSLASALDHASTGLVLSKVGAAGGVRHATVTASVHDLAGRYRVTVDATDTNTKGHNRLDYADAGVCLPAWLEFMVIDAEEYERKYGKGIPVVRGTCVASGSSVTLLKTTGLSPAAVTANQYKGKVLVFDKNTTTAALRGQYTNVTASNTSGDLTVEALTTVPADGDTFVMN
jgi:hypothetical protein